MVAQATVRCTTCVCSFPVGKGICVICSCKLNDCICWLARAAQTGCSHESADGAPLHAVPISNNDDALSAADIHHRPTIKWGTDFSGMDAMGYVMKKLTTHLNSAHVFSCELMTKQVQFIQRNYCPAFIQRNISTRHPVDTDLDVYGAGPPSGNCCLWEEKGMERSPQHALLQINRLHKVAAPKNIPPRTLQPYFILR